jgi:hypothetical protein
MTNVQRHLARARSATSAPSLKPSVPCGTDWGTDVLLHVDFVSHELRRGVSG